MTEEAEKLLERKRELEADLAWRVPDLEQEEAELKRLQEDPDPNSLIAIGAQIIVVGMITGIVGDHRAELEAVDKRLGELKRAEAPGGDGA